MSRDVDKASDKSAVECHYISGLSYFHCISLIYPISMLRSGARLNRLHGIRQPRNACPVHYFCSLSSFFSFFTRLIIAMVQETHNFPLRFGTAMIECKAPCGMGWDAERRSLREILCLLWLVCRFPFCVDPSYSHQLVSSSSPFYRKYPLSVLQAPSPAMSSTGRYHSCRDPQPPDPGTQPARWTAC